MKQTPVKQPDLTASSTLLELLNQGCKITFPGGYYLNGLPKEQGIAVGTQFAGEGVWALNNGGVDDAIADVTKLAQRDGFDLAGRAIALPEE